MNESSLNVTKKSLTNSNLFTYTTDKELEGYLGTASDDIAEYLWDEQVSDPSTYIAYAFSTSSGSAIIEEVHYIDTTTDDYKYSLVNNGSGGFNTINVGTPVSSTGYPGFSYLFGGCPEGFTALDFIPYDVGFSAYQTRFTVATLGYQLSHMGSAYKVRFEITNGFLGTTICGSAPDL